MYRKEVLLVRLKTVPWWKTFPP